MYKIMTSKAHGHRQVAVSYDLKTAHARAIAGSQIDCECGGCLYVEDEYGNALNMMDLEDDALLETMQLADALREAFADRP
jgi:hypothetical protein